jgi:PAT family beta-lactamase induction signal transducer AmpG
MSTSSPSLREAFAQPAALTLFFFGFTSGLPFLLVGGTLSAWLKESGVSLEDIGLMSLAGLAYSFKFLWSPAVDRIRLPRTWQVAGTTSFLAVGGTDRSCP